MGGAAFQGTPFAGITLFDVLNLTAQYRLQTGTDDQIAVTAGVDLLHWVHAPQKEEIKRGRIARPRYERYFEEIEKRKPTEAEARWRSHIRQQVNEKKPRFLKTLRLLREQGIQFKPMPNILVLDEVPSNIVSDESSFDAINLKKAFQHASSGKIQFSDRHGRIGRLGFPIDLGDLSPATLVENGAIKNLELDPALQLPEESEINCPFLSLHFEFDDDSYRVALWDWFEGEPFFEKVYPKVQKDDSFFWGEVAVELKKAADRHFNDSDVAGQIEKLSPLTKEEKGELEEKRVFVANRPAGWTAADIEEAQKSWEQLSKRFVPTLFAQPFGKEVDREEKLSFLIYPSLALKLSPKRLEKAAHLPIEVRGFLNTITLEPHDKATALELGKDPLLNRDIFTSLFQDKYGNWILPLPGKQIRTGKPYFSGFTISPKFHLAKDASGGGVPQTVGVDLSPFGLGDHPHLLTTLSIPPTLIPDSKIPYYLYSTLPPVDQPKSEGVFERAAQLTAEVEKSLGFSPGEKVKSIFYIPSAEKNASVRFSNPETFFIWDEIFPDIKSGKGDFVVPHEVYHTFDAQFQFSLHQPFREFFAKLKETEDGELFYTINEDRFLSKEYGGHSQDNIFEFLASLMNTVHAPEWEARVAAMSPRVQGLYYHSLKALAGALVAKHPPIVSAPLYRRLQERLSSLEKSSFPPFERLAFRPVGKLLREGPHPVRVLESSEFEKEVLQANGPVIVYLFTVSDRDRVAEIQETFSRYRGKGKIVAFSYKEADHFMDEFRGGMSSPSFNLFVDGKLTDRTKWDAFSPISLDQMLLEMEEKTK